MPGRRHVLLTALLWILLTIAGELAVLRADPYPFAAAREAEVIDRAFRFLLLLAVPVFAFVLAVLIYAVLRFRRAGEPAEDGPPLRGHPAVTWTWLLATSALAVFVIFNPGLAGLAELRPGRAPDLVVRVEGARWYWKISYPAYGITTRELVLPEGRLVRIEVTSIDVLHAFWVPAFRVKVDAVPGMVTAVHVTPTRVAARQDDFTMRLQCAELCGPGHGLMVAPVTVLPPERFEAWAAAQARP